MNQIATKIVRLTLVCIAAAMLLIGCSHETKEVSSLETACSKFAIQNFSPITNYQPEAKALKTIHMDYNNALDGFCIPSVRQTEDGFFKFSFELKNTSSNKQKFYYKIFYQNESYKFPEYDSLTKSEHTFAEENFYGSWEDTTIGYKETPIIPADNSFHTIEDKIRIVGNPRNEQRYVQRGENNRWQRNPRVGQYSFLLVVSTAKDVNSIPVYAQFINKKNKNHFVNPYYYFLFGEGKKIEEKVVLKSASKLKVFAQPNLGAGVYIDEGHLGGNDTPNTEPVDRSSYCATCGRDTELYKNAAIQQFINYVDASTKFDNIPVIADVIKDNYSQMDYNWNRNFYKKEELIPTIIQTSKRPCETVISDPIEKKLVIKNPATKYGEWKKESVGIITRHGFTYGKYRVKVKLTELLSKNGVWNGLTNAIWLLTQARAEWNFRRTCNKDGYMETYWGGANDKRVPNVGYSEIDFEILKTPPYCPDNTFPPVYKNAQTNNKNVNDWNVSMPDEITSKNNDQITVACTNWDMACHEPKNFGVYCNEIQKYDLTFYTHRWDSNYRALTEKKEESDDELFKSKFFYFEIEWKPTEIIWRIGASPNNMRVVGYMNDEVTSIPNNQMVLIITQEFHNTKWWPGAPYKQENIPFPLNDIVGEIYDLTIE